MKLINEDIIVKTIWGKSSSWVVDNNVGISLYHKPTDTTVTINHNKSVHKNKAEAMAILSVAISDDTNESDEYINLPQESCELFHKWIAERWLIEDISAMEGELSELKETLTNYWK